MRVNSDSSSQTSMLAEVRYHSCSLINRHCLWVGRHDAKNIPTVIFLETRHDLDHSITLWPVLSGVDGLLHSKVVSYEMEYLQHGSLSCFLKSRYVGFAPVHLGVLCATAPSCLHQVSCHASKQYLMCIQKYVNGCHKIRVEAHAATSKCISKEWCFHAWIWIRTCCLALDVYVLFSIFQLRGICP